jgi:hypothetical protein
MIIREGRRLKRIAMRIIRWYSLTIVRVVLLNSICLDWRSLENHSMTLGRGDLQMRTMNDLAASLVE